jgi:hypothetical protein
VLATRALTRDYAGARSAPSRPEWVTEHDSHRELQRVRHHRKGVTMTADPHIPASLLAHRRHETAWIAPSPGDRTYDFGETCARCGPGTRARFKWVFSRISDLTQEHCDLYLCTHCSARGELRLLTSSILRVDAHDLLGPSVSR